MILLFEQHPLAGSLGPERRQLLILDIALQSTHYRSRLAEKGKTLAIQTITKTPLPLFRSANRVFGDGKRIAHLERCGRGERYVLVSTAQ